MKTKFAPNVKKSLCSVLWKLSVENGNQLDFTCTAGGSFLRTFSTSSLTFYQTGVNTLQQYG